MRRVLEFPARDGAAIVAEVEEEGGRYENEVVTAEGRIIQKAAKSFEQALAVVHSVSAGFEELARQLPGRPDEITAEFGVKLTADIGAILAKASTEGSIKVSLKWKRTA